MRGGEGRVASEPKISATPELEEAERTVLYRFQWERGLADTRIYPPELSHISVVCNHVFGGALLGSPRKLIQGSNEQPGNHKDHLI